MRFAKYFGKVLFISLALTALPALSQDLDGSSDHPLLSRFPGAAIVGYEQWAHNQTFIPSQENLAAGNWVAGKLTWIAYRTPPDVSVLQLYRNYEKALNDAGFTTVFACRKEECGSKFVRNMLRISGRYINNSERWQPGTISYLAAKLSGESGDVWVSLAIYASNQEGQAIVRQEIVEASSARSVDTIPAVNAGKKSVTYDEAKVAAGAADKRKISIVHELEGKVDWNVFRYGADVSAYEVFTSWATHAKENDYLFEFSCARQACGSGFIRGLIDLNGLVADKGDSWSQDSGYYFQAKSVKSGKTTYLGLLAYKQPNGVAVSHSLLVVTDTPEFNQITVNAETLVAEIEEKGKVAVYGIYFDTDEAEIKTQSVPMLEQISRLMQLRPQLALFVDGHTDDQGEEDYNLELSRQRAEAVVGALVANYGVDQVRLESRGFGEGEPIESNDTDDGRAKNRRVELVAK